MVFATGMRTQLGRIAALSQHVEAGVHGVRGNEKLGDEILVCLVAAADFVHRGDHRVVNEGLGVHPGGEARLCDFFRGFGVAVEYRVVERLDHWHGVLLSLGYSAPYS